MTQVLALILGLLVVVGVFYVLLRPQWAVLVILIMFPLEQLLIAYFPAIGGAKSWIFNVAVGMLALLGVGSRMARGESVTVGYFNPTLFFVALIYLLTLAGLLYTPSPDFGFYIVKRGFPYWGLQLVLMPLLIRDAADMRRVLTGLMFVGSIIVLLFLLHPAARYQSARLVLEQGAFSGQQRSSPLATATFGCTMALAAVYLRYDRRSTLILLVRWSALILGLGLALKSGSRGQTIGVVAAGVLCYPLARPVRNPKQFFLMAAGLAFVILLGFITVKLFVSQENVGRWGAAGAAKAIRGRFETIQTLGAAWVSSPQSWLFGLGTGANNAMPGTQGYAHNLLADALFEHGIVGAGILFGIMLTTFLAGRQLFRFFRDDLTWRSVAALLIVISLFHFVISLKQGTFHGSAAPFYWWLLVAKIWRYEQIVRAEEPEFFEEADFDGHALDEDLFDPATAG